VDFLVEHKRLTKIGVKYKEECEVIFLEFKVLN